MQEGVSFFQPPPPMFDGDAKKSRTVHSGSTPMKVISANFLCFGLLDLLIDAKDIVFKDVVNGSLNLLVVFFF